MKFQLIIDLENEKELVEVASRLQEVKLIGEMKFIPSKAEQLIKEPIAPIVPKVDKPLPVIEKDATPVEVKCANPKCNNYFTPKRNGNTCSSKCGVMVNWLKKKENSEPSLKKSRKPYTRKSLMGGNALG